MQKSCRKILILSFLASMLALEPAWTQQSKPESTQGSQQDLPLYTEAQVQAAIRAAAQKAVDKAVPLAVQAAVAEYAGQLAASKAEKLALTRKAGLWRTLGLSASLGVVGTLLEGKAGQGTAWGAGLGAIGGAIWYLAESWSQ